MIFMTQNDLKHDGWDYLGTGTCDRRSVWGNNFLFLPARGISMKKTKFSSGKGKYGGCCVLKAS